MQGVIDSSVKMLTIIFVQIDYWDWSCFKIKVTHFYFALIELAIISPNLSELQFSMLKFTPFPQKHQNLEYIPPSLIKQSMKPDTHARGFRCRDSQTRAQSG